jgi:hypothetical protein
LKKGKGEGMMKQLRLPVVFAILVLAGLAAVLHPQLVRAEKDFDGASYLITVKTSTGGFASRGVIVLHSDHTMSVTDSGEGGPTFFFTSQLGVWKPDGRGGLVARTLDFDFPPNADVARLDYAISFSLQGTAVAGTITLTTFPLQANPLDGGGTIAGTFSFTGQLIKL